MKGKIKNMASRVMGFVAAMVCMVAVSNANSACLFWSYQPDLPDELAN